MRASERAYHQLRADIIGWRLRPGYVLAEVELSERLGISRTPVREAISRLASDGLAEPASTRGFAVSQISAEDVRDLYELRDCLDTRAAALAAQRGAPETFHRLAGELAEAARCVQHEEAHAHRHSGQDEYPAYFELVARMDAAVDQAANNVYLRQAQASVRLRLARVRRLSTSDPQRLVLAATEHRAIAEAIAHGDSSLAIATTRVHLANALEHALASKELAAAEPALPSASEANASMPSPAS